MALASPIAWGTIKNALYDWLHDVLGIEVDWTNQDAEALDYPYATLGVIAGPKRIGGADRRERVTQLDGRIKDHVVGDRSITLSVEAHVSFEGRAHDHDTDAVALMTTAQASLALDSVLDTLQAAGIGVWTVGAVQDRSTALDAGWVSRAGFDVTLHLISMIIPESTEPIETAHMTGDLGSEALSIDKDFGNRSVTVRFYGETSVSASAPTAIATPGTFTKVLGTYAAGELQDFDSPVSGRLRYTGTEARPHKVSIAASGIVASAPADVKIGISKNGAQPTVFLEVAAGSSKVGGYVEDVLELEEDDYVEAWVTADGGVDVTVGRLSVIAIA